jgi:acyl dehydratase
MPDLVLTLPSVSVERERLAAYDRVCGFSLSDTLPPTYIHILAFPLHLALMTDSSFPFPAIGLVHIANEITQHRRVDAAETLSLRVLPTPLEPHPRGRQFRLRTEARAGEEVVWQEVATILRRGAGGAGGRGPSSGVGATAAGAPGDMGTAVGAGAARGPAGPPAPSSQQVPPGSQELPSTATWKLRGDLGRRYAGVSGDVNPIHMHALTAKLLGFPSAIAHGMWTKARCLAALETRLPTSFTVEVSFRRPIVLPATVSFAEAPDPGDAGSAGIRFGVRDARKATPHLDGLVRFR